MAKYHITAKGEPGLCRAHKGKCPLGGEGEHYPTKEAAQAAFEKEMGAHATPLTKAPAMWTGAFQVKGAFKKQVLDLLNDPKGGEKAQALAQEFETIAAHKFTTLPDVEEYIQEHPLDTREGIKGATPEMNLALLAAEDDSRDARSEFYAAASKRYGEEVGTLPVSPEAKALASSLSWSPSWAEDTTGEAMSRSVAAYLNELPKYKKKTLAKSKKSVEKQGSKSGFSEGKTTYKNMVLAHCQGPADNQHGFTNYNLVVPDVERLTDKRRLEIGQAVWEASGRDMAPWEQASEEQKLSWTKSHMGRYGDAEVELSEGRVSVSMEGSTFSNVPEGEISLFKLS